jgi:hypothetical protein
MSVHTADDMLFIYGGYSKEKDSTLKKEGRIHEDMWQLSLKALLTTAGEKINILLLLYYTILYYTIYYTIHYILYYILYTNLYYILYYTAYSTIHYSILTIPIIITITITILYLLCCTLLYINIAL